MIKKIEHDDKGALQNTKTEISCEDRKELGNLRNSIVANLVSAYIYTSLPRVYCKQRFCLIGNFIRLGPLRIFGGGVPLAKTGVQRGEPCSSGYSKGILLG